MSRLDEHPTVVAHRMQKTSAPEAPSLGPSFEPHQVVALALECGADDAGIVSIDHPDLASDRALILSAFPFAKSLIAIVKRMNRENVRSTARSLANLEFHEAGDDVNDAGREIARRLQSMGARAANANMAFPMEADRWPERIWIVAHKPVAVAAGLGRMGIHRNVIHPRFGNFILLGTIVTDIEPAAYSAPLDYNPCLECKLCVAACPTGAISPDGAFNFQACYTHNYREFMGGFSDWVETIADSGSASDYRDKVSDSETVSMWQSLAFGPNYKAAYCLAVCPAGSDVIGPYLADKKGYVEQIVRPLQDKEEAIYALKGSDAELAVARRFPRKRIRHVGFGLRPTSVATFLSGMSLAFQRERASGLRAVYHFIFTGTEKAEATVTIRDKKLSVEQGLSGKADLTIRADGAAWVRFLRKDLSMPWAIATGRVRLRGSPRLLFAFARCFPG